MTALDSRLSTAFRRATRPVVGVISTWPVYQGTTIDRHAHALLRGISAAARDQGCDLLLGAGISTVTDRGRWRTVWPVPAPDTDLVPVGPWNADGLIVLPDELSTTQSRYLDDVQAAGVPIVFTTGEGSGHRVVVDNAGGIRQAVGHLIDHGHRRIAFIAGKEHRGGDSAERLRAFHEALAASGLEADPELIAYGEHRADAGRAAMERILRTGSPFTAFVASNDLSCIGAVAALRAAGRHMPDDVAGIGFDDILDARSQTPSLTTVRHPTFAQGYDAVVALLGRIDGRQDAPGVVVEPTRLIVRGSCGCRPDRLDPSPPGSADPAATLAALTQLMARAAYGEARHSTLGELEEQCGRFLDALLVAVSGGVDRPLRDDTTRLLDWGDARDEDAHAWQAAISALYRSSAAVRSLTPGADQAMILEQLDHARLEVAEHARRQTYKALLQHMDMMSRLGLLTSQLLATLEVARIREILAEHLPGLGIEHALVCLYDGGADDPGTSSQVVIATGLAASAVGRRFRTRDFPPPGMYPDTAPLQLLLVPIVISEGECGFVALSAGSLEPAAAIVGNLATAMRASHLYREAVEGRRLAEDASTLKSRFLSMVSHELRTPLSVVVGLSDIILREARERDGPSSAIVADLQRMSLSAEHLGRLIGDVLDMASSEAGQLRLQLQPLDLAEVLSTAASVGRQMALANGLDFQADLPATGPWVIGDRTRLRQVALNLISNAVKFTDAGCVSLQVDVVADRVTVSVSDTGIGVPIGEQEAIFAEFHRSERSARHGRGGMGLGLAIARQLIQLHGGTIGIRSPGTLGCGSTFSFTLPIASPPPAGPGSEDPARHEDPARDRVPTGIGAARGGVVLVVDDDPDILELHARIVAEAGGRALRATDGRQALAALDTERPDLVLLDLGMPGMDGFELLDVLRARASMRDIPVIVVTGQSLPDAALDRLQLGVATILSKGVFSSAETLARIESVLSQRRSLGSATQRLVRRAVTFIEQNHAEPLTREQVARHVAMSADYLTDCFQQELGLAPMAYLNRCRIRHARELLETTDQTITSIAMAVGFSEVSHFTRTFHRDVGVSPRAYRRGEQRAL